MHTTNTWWKQKFIALQCHWLTHTCWYLKHLKFQKQFQVWEENRKQNIKIYYWNHKMKFVCVIQKIFWLVVIVQRASTISLYIRGISPLSLSLSFSYPLYNQTTTFYCFATVLSFNVFILCRSKCFENKSNISLRRKYIFFFFCPAILHTSTFSRRDIIAACVLQIEVRVSDTKQLENEFFRPHKNKYHTCLSNKYPILL